MEQTERVYAVLDTNGEVEILFPTVRDLFLFMERSDLEPGRTVACVPVRTLSREELT